MIYGTRSNHCPFGITKSFLPNEPWFTCLVQRYPHCPENPGTVLSTTAAPAVAPGPAITR